MTRHELIGNATLRGHAHRPPDKRARDGRLPLKRGRGLKVSYDKYICMENKNKILFNYHSLSFYILRERSCPV